MTRAILGMSGVIALAALAAASGDVGYERQAYSRYREEPTLPKPKKKRSFKGSPAAKRLTKRKRRG
jgi:hypothetical protein